MQERLQRPELQRYRGLLATFRPGILGSKPLPHVCHWAWAQKHHLTSRRHPTLYLVGDLLIWHVDAYLFIWIYVSGLLPFLCLPSLALLYSRLLPPSWGKVKKSDASEPSERARLLG